MKGASFSPSVSACGDQALQHLDQPLDRSLPGRLVIGMAPEFGLPDRGLRQIRRLLPAGFDHAAADIGAADIDRQDAVMGLEDPGRRQMQAADQARFIRMKADRHQVDLEFLGLENDVGARDREFADPALPEAAADHDAFGIGPGLGLEKPPRHIGQFLGEFLDRAMHQGGGVDIVADQRLVEFALADVMRSLSCRADRRRCPSALRRPSRISAERALAGAVAEKAVVVLQFDIEAVDLHRRQPGSAVAGDARGGDDIFSHFAPAMPGMAGQRRGNPLVSWRVGSNGE